MAHPSDWGLEDPKMVGASEYHAIYETLADALDGCEEDIAAAGLADPLSAGIRDFALTVLDEFISHAQAMKTQIIASGEPT